jgi:DNA-binding XRE family transcriptional regulator
MQNEVKIKMPHMLFAKCDNIPMGFREPIENDFPNVLLSLRTLFKWSKSEAARRAGISASLYGRYESGEVEPTLSNILKLLMAFRVDFETMIGEKAHNIVPSGKGPSNAA